MPALSLADFGRYTLIFAIATQILLFTKSLVLNPMIKFAAEPGRFGDMSLVGFWGAGAVQAAIFGVIVLIAPWGEKIFRLQPNDLIIAGAIPLVFWIRDWGFCVQQTLFKTRSLFWIEMMYWGVSAGGYVWFRFAGLGNAEWVLAINFGAAILSSLLAIATWPKDIGLKLKVDMGSASQLFRYGVYTIGLGLSASLLAGADLIVLGAIYNAEIVGIYGGAKRIYSVVAVLVSTVGLLLIPYTSRLSSEQRMPEIRALFEKTIAYMVLGMAIAVGVGWFAAAPFYHYILPNTYEKSVPLFRLLLLAAPFEGLYYSTAAILYGIGAASVTVVTSSLGLGVLVILLPTGAYFFGNSGAAVAQVTVTAFVGVMMTWRAGQNAGAEWGTTVARIPSALRGVMQRLGGSR